MSEKKKPQWRLVCKYDIKRYACGLRAGDRVRLIKDIVVFDSSGEPTGEIFPAGEIWLVLKGSSEDPGTVWFRQADGHRHTWDDDREIWDWFEKLPEDKSGTG